MFVNDMDDGVERLAENNLNLRGLYRDVGIAVWEQELLNPQTSYSLELNSLSCVLELRNGWMGNEDQVCISRFKKMIFKTSII